MQIISFLTRLPKPAHPHNTQTTTSVLHHYETMAEEDEIAALVIDNGSGMCKGG
jgi:hypothetical protein